MLAALVYFQGSLSLRHMRDDSTQGGSSTACRVVCCGRALCLFQSDCGAWQAAKIRRDATSSLHRGPGFPNVPFHTPFAHHAEGQTGQQQLSLMFSNTGFHSKEELRGGSGTTGDPGCGGESLPDELKEQFSSLRPSEREASETVRQKRAAHTHILTAASYTSVSSRSQGGPHFIWELCGSGVHLIQKPHF